MDSQEIKKAGLKVTLPRLKVLKILESSAERHMSAEDIYKQLVAAGEDVSLATVYRVLTQFEAAGLIIRHGFETAHAVYELDQGKHHDHLVCTNCGRIEEFVDEIIEQRQQQVAQQRNFTITDHCLYIYGICPACQ